MTENVLATIPYIKSFTKNAKKDQFPSSQLWGFAFVFFVLCDSKLHRGFRLLVEQVKTSEDVTFTLGNSNCYCIIAIVYTMQLSKKSKK